MTKSYDLMVIGAGPGGYVAAIKAAQLGRRVAVVESREVGGTCLNCGCIPTKTFVHAAELWQELDHAQTLGLAIEKKAFDMNALHAHKDRVVAQLRDGIEQLLAANKVDILRGTGTILAPGEVAVEGVSYSCEKILIATGSVPAFPASGSGFDLPGVVTSDELLATGSAPCPRLCIVGGGVIGVEFAGVYAAMGCRVTLVEFKDRILPLLDREISQSLAMSLKKQGVQILTGAAVERIRQEDGGLCCQVRVKEEAQSIFADGVLVATGRKANTAGLFGEGFGLAMERGQIVVDKDFAASVPGIYAIGDVILGSIQLAHAASAQGVNAVCAMFGEVPLYNLDVIPSCIYTRPEIATVGLSADAAKERGIPVKTGKYLTAGAGKSLIAMAGRGFIKLVFHGETEVLLGAQLLCERATDMVGGLAAAIANGLTREEMAKTVWPHPTFCEGIGEAVEDAGGQAIHSPPKRQG